MIKFSATLLATLIAASVQAATVDLRILETTDLHSNMMDFDYYKDTPTEKFGLVRTASLIDAARGDGHLRQRLVESAHTRLLVCDGGLDHLRGVVQSRDLLAALIAGSPLDLAAQLRQPLRLAEASSALEALQQLRRQHQEHWQC